MQLVLDENPAVEDCAHGRLHHLPGAFHSLRQDRRPSCVDGAPLLTCRRCDAPPVATAKPFVEQHGQVSRDWPQQPGRRVDHRGGPARNRAIHAIALAYVPPPLARHGAVINPCSPTAREGDVGE